jgi:hypothetical protein
MSSASFVANRMLGDAHFLYTAFAPIQRNQRDPAKRSAANEVLVKVGISRTPMNRLMAIHHNSPFRVELAAFAPAGWKRTAQLAEKRILACFREYRTRGEWLMLPCTPDMKAQFAKKARVILGDVTGAPVTWTRVTNQQIAELAIAKLNKAA